MKDAGAVLVFVHANPTIVTFDPWYPYVKERVPLVESRGLEQRYPVLATHVPPRKFAPLNMPSE